ncbi:MAG TPA: ROK family protein [Acidimicrobiales bacterium]|nr:ROK family protein [Acidimicrobiales bacterium]
MTVLGVDLGGTKCLGVALEGGEIVEEVRLPTPAGGDALLGVLSTVVDRLRGPSTPEAVGVGAPGLVDHDGVLHFAPNLTLEGELNLRSALAERLGVRVQVDNDATCAAWGERAHGAARGYDDVVLVTLGTGIGGGIVAGGRIVRGANGFAGEMGHMVVDPQGPRCPCGQRGCWERFASGSGLRRLGREAARTGEAPRLLDLAGGDPEQVRGEHVSVAVGEGDKGAAEVVARFAWWVALGLVNLTNIFDPDAFVVGGGVIGLGDALFTPARAAFADLLQGKGRRPPVAVLPAALGERAGAIGAAYLAAEAAGR